MTIMELIAALIVIDIIATIVLTIVAVQARNEAFAARHYAEYSMDYLLRLKRKIVDLCSYEETILYRKFLKFLEYETEKGDSNGKSEI